MEKQINAIFDQYEEDLSIFSSSNELGSCQYKTIEDTHRWALALIEVMGRSEFEKLLQISYTKEATMEEIERDLYTILDNTQIDEDLKEWGIEDTRDHENKRITLSNYIELTKDMSWDLWSAAIHPFTDFEMGNPINIPTHGPLLNQMCQDENFEIGIWLAYFELIYDIPLSAWEGYDT